jgi:hypothetical protein
MPPSYANLDDRPDSVRAYQLRKRSGLRFVTALEEYNPFGRGRAE